jgi:molecular chaperone DnaJ
VANLDVARILQIAPCPACVGVTCPLCEGTGTTSAERRIRLVIPPGVDDGAQLRVSGDGHYAGLGSIPGDLLVDVRVLPEPRDPRVVRYLAFVLLVVAVATLVAYVVSH